MNPVMQLLKIKNGVLEYTAVMFWCPGCEYLYKDDPDPAGGLHMLPVDGDTPFPKWTFNGNLEKPTLSPSILSSHDFARRPGPDGEIVEQKFVCHSFLVDGVFQFLGDCTHQYANQFVPIPPLPDWVVEEKKMEGYNEH